MRKGSSQRGHKRFVEELIARVRRAGATGTLTVCGDSGFWSYALIDTLHRLGVHWSITVSISKEIRARIDAIDETAWATIHYPDGGEAQVADTTITAGKSKRLQTVRLVVRRTRLTDPTQAALWPNWRHHAFITDLDLAAVEMDQFHRVHATVELAIRDLKDGARARALRVRQVLRQRRLARLRGARPQPHPLDRSARRHPPRRAAHRHPHRPHPGARVARPARQPQRPPRAPTPSPLAMASHVSRALDQLRALPMLS